MSRLTRDITAKPLTCETKFLSAIRDGKFVEHTKMLSMTPLYYGGPIKIIHYVANPMPTWGIL